MKTIPGSDKLLGDTGNRKWVEVFEIVKYACNLPQG
jgi:hypothetical protein